MLVLGTMAQEATGNWLDKAGNLAGLADPKTARDNMGMDGFRNKWVRKTANYPAVHGDKLRADTSGGSWTLTLPPNPTDGEEIEFADPGTWTTYPLLVDPGTKNIGGDPGVMTCAWGGVSHRLIFNAAADNWEGDSSAVATGDQGSALVHLETLTAANDATLDFTNFVDTTKYSAYMFIFEAVFPATDNVTFAIRTSSDGGTTWDADTSGYVSASQHVTSAESGVTDNPQTYAWIGSNVGNVGGGGDQENGVCGDMKLFGMATGNPPSGLANLQYHQSATYNSVWQSSWQRHNVGSFTNANAIQFFFHSGNIQSGSISLYGIRKG